MFLAEEINIAIALVFLAVGSYFDIKNNRNIPDVLAYVFVGIALLLALFNKDYVAIVEGVVVFILSYVLYKVGQLGLADVFYFAALALLFPFPPSMTGVGLPIPFIVLVLVYSILLAAYAVMFWFVYRVIKEKKRVEIKNKMFLVIGALYILLALFFLQTPAYQLLGANFFLLIIMFGLLTAFFGLFKDYLEEMFIGEEDLDKCEEEVIVLKKHPELKEMFMFSRVIGKENIEKLKEMGYKKIYIYKHLPPFLPFLTLGFLIALFFSKLLIPF